MRTFLAAWVSNEPTAKQAEAVQKLKINLGEYEALDDEEKAFYIVEPLDKDLRAPFMHGVSRFERLLDPFGLAGPVDDQVGKNLYEMNQIRNVLVHRRGIADRRFVNACPHLGLSVGDRVTVNRKVFHQHSDSVADYTVVMIERIKAHFDVQEAGTEENGASPGKARP